MAGTRLSNSQNVSVWIAAIIVVFCAATASAQGSLCGTVRNAETGQGIPGAGVFLFEQDGSYTGLSDVTDESGGFCIHDIPAGSYALQVAVDDFQVGYRSDIVIPDAGTGVDITVRPPPGRLLAPWPNPAAGRVFFGLRVDRDLPVRLKVFDLRGRLVKGWRADSAADEITFEWDFRDHRGLEVPAGLYMVRMEIGDWSEDRTFVRVR